MTETIRPLGARVLVRVLEEESVTPTGLLIPDTAKEKPQRGEVVAVGDDEDIKVAPGDKVLYPKYSGTELRLGGVDHLILEASDILAVIESTASQAA
jgi:chaperonin GroES